MITQLRIVMEIDVPKILGTLYHTYILWFIYIPILKITFIADGIGSVANT